MAFFDGYLVLKKTNLYTALVFFVDFFLVYMIDINTKTCTKDKILIVLYVEVAFSTLFS